MGASGEAGVGPALGMSAASGAIALLGLQMTSDQTAAEPESTPQVQWETAYWKMFDLNTLPGESNSKPKHFTEFQGKPYFSADSTYDDGTGSALCFVANDGIEGRELFKFDGTDVTRFTDLNTDNPDGRY